MLRKRDAFDDSFAAVYGELRRLAQQYFRGERSEHTLAATALVHEVYLRMMDSQGQGLEGRAGFFAMAARAMRQTLIDHARRRDAEKRGGRRQRLTLDEHHAVSDLDVEELLALNDALERLGLLEQRLKQVVEYRFFCGLEEAQIAELLGVSERTVERDWRKAKAWLHSELYSLD